MIYNENDWIREDKPKTSHLKKFYIIGFVILLIIAVTAVTVLFLLPKKEYFNITFSGDQQTIANLQGDGKYEKGKTATITALDREGYVFDNWTYNDVIVSTEQTYTFVVKQETAGTYIANYTAIDYVITSFSTNGNFQVVQSANIGDIVEITNINPDKGFEYKRMYYTVEDSTREYPIYNNSFYMPAKDIEIIVEFEALNYTISYEVNGGELIDPPTTYTVQSVDIVLPTPTRFGYNFLGWTGTETPQPSKRVTITRGSIGNRSYTANWEVNQYNVYKANIQNGNIEIPVTAGYESVVSIFVNPDPGYKLIKLYYVVEGQTQQISIVDNSFIMPANNVTVYAEFDIVKYVVSKGDIENGTVLISKLGANYGDTISVIPQANSGYEFVRTFYTVAGGDTQYDFSNSFIMPDGDVVVWAEFTPVTYTITLNLNGGSITDGGTKQEGTFQYCEYNIESSAITLPNPDIRDGHTYLGWTGTDLETQTTNVIIPTGSTGDRYYTANWRIHTFTITFKNDNGDILLTLTQVPYGTLPTFTGETPTKNSTVQYDYVFSGWSPNLTEAVGDQIYTAQYNSIIRKYTASFDTRGGSSVENITKDYNSTIGTLPTTTRDGYNFLGWFTQASGGTQIFESTLITSNKTYYAQWETIQYTITLILDGGTISGSTSIIYTIEDSNFDLPTPTKEGFSFLGWTGEDIDIPTKPLTIYHGSMGDRTYSANYETLKYTVTWRNFDNSVLKTDLEVPYGTMPSYTGEEPTKPSDQQYNYRFSKWTPEITKVVGDQVYTATFNNFLNSYTVTFESNNGTPVESITKLYGETFETLPHTEREGYTLLGWFTELDGETQLTVDTQILDNVTYYAHWEILKFTVKWQNYNSTILETDYNVEWGTLPEYNGSTPIRPQDNTTIYTFSGWSPNVGVITATDNSQDIIYTAQFNSETRKYTITFKQQNGLQDIIVQKQHNDVLGAFPEVNYLGYDLKGWFDNAVSGNEITEQTIVNGNATYYAQWNLHTYSIQYNYDGGVGSGKTEYTIIDADFNLPIPTKTGYEFQGWTGTGLSTPTKNVTISQGSTGDRVYTATWTQQTYTITKANTTNGSFNLVSEAIYNQNIIITVTPDIGCQVSKVYYCLSGSSEQVAINNLTFNMPASDITVYVEFEKLEYTVTLGKTANGTFAANPTRATYGQQITITTNPNSGYSVIDIYYVIEGSQEHIQISDNQFTMPANNVTVYVEFEIVNTLMLNVDGVNKEYQVIGQQTLAQIIPEQYDENNTCGYYAIDENGDYQWYDGSYQITNDLELYTKTATLSKLIFTLNSDSASYSVKGIENVTGSIVIPKLYNDVPVTEIENHAFKSLTVTEVTMPYGIESIEHWAFDGSSFTEIVIPDSVTTIGMMFMECHNLQRITIPKSVITITTGGNFGRQIFLNCENLSEIVVDEENPVFDSRNNCNAIIETATNTLICGCKNTIIPQTVTSIGDYAFQWVDSLTSISIPSNITRIGVYAFKDCTQLTNVTISNGVKTIGDSAFSNCSSLTQILIPSSVTSIGANPLSSCSNLGSIIVDGSNSKYTSRDNNGQEVNAIIDISTNTLISGCKNTIIPKTIITIGDYAFTGCSGLLSITIPNTVTAIGESAFASCRELKSIFVDSPTIYGKLTGVGELYCGNILSYNEQVYILSSIDNGTNEYLNSTSNYPYQYNDISIEGKMYNLYSKTKIFSVFSNDESLGSVEYTGTPVSGNSVTLKSNPATNAFFLGWKKGSLDGSYVSTSANYTFALNDSNMDIYYGVFASTTYTDSIGLVYTINPDTQKATVKSYTGTSSNLTVPSSFTAYSRSFTVDAIGLAAFKDNQTISNVNLPNTIKSIGYYAFLASSLKNISIPTSVETIGSLAFAGLSGTVNINMDKNSNLKTIGEYVFVSVDGVPVKYFYNVPIIIGDKVTSIEGNLVSINYSTYLYIGKSLNNVADDSFTNIDNIYIASEWIYNNATSASASVCGGVLGYGDDANHGRWDIRYKSKIYVLKSIVDNINNSNSYLNDSNNYIKSSTVYTLDGDDYYLYTKTSTLTG